MRQVVVQHTLKITHRSCGRLLPDTHYKIPTGRAAGCCATHTLVPTDHAAGYCPTHIKYHPPVMRQVVPHIKIYPPIMQQVVVRHTLKIYPPIMRQVVVRHTWKITHRSCGRLSSTSIIITYVCCQSGLLPQVDTSHALPRDR